MEVGPISRRLLRRHASWSSYSHTPQLSHASVCARCCQCVQPWTNNPFHGLIGLRMVAEEGYLGMVMAVQVIPIPVCLEPGAHYRSNFMSNEKIIEALLCKRRKRGMSGLGGPSTGNGSTSIFSNAFPFSFSSDGSRRGEGSGRCGRRRAAVICRVGQERVLAGRDRTGSVGQNRMEEEDEEEDEEEQEEDEVEEEGRSERPEGNGRGLLQLKRPAWGPPQCKWMCP